MDSHVPLAIHRIFEDVWNRKKPDVLAEVCSDGFTFCSGDEVSGDRQALKQAVIDWLGAFPDMDYEILDVIVQERKTAVRWQGAGTHRGAFMGVPATGKTVKYSGVTVFESDDDKIHRAWVYAGVDRLIRELKDEYSRQQKADVPPPRFSDDLTGPAQKIYEEVLRVRPIAPAKQMIAEALRKDFEPADVPLQLIVPQEIMDHVRVSEIKTPGPAGDVRSLVYRPDSAEATAPVLIYAHGGGWCMGEPEVCDLVCRKLCHLAGVVVVSVDYRLAPEFPFPHGLDDFVAVYRWVRGNAEKELCANPERVAVGGDSSGGNLAAALPLRVRDAGGRLPDATLLLCPGTDFMFESYESFNNVAANSLIYDAAFCGYVRSNYVPYAEQWSNPHVSPTRGDLKGYPPSFILAAGADILLSDNKRFAEKLREAGNAEVELLVHDAMPHAYYYFLGLCREEEEAYRAMAAFLKRVLH